ncbi:hypothetical protein JK208_12580 [Gluconobacter sp. Dm-74]|uniref:hypothetical protein n=1 Tax=Gluconobacter TaxID=441 RepID=UPI001B8B78BD|nr:MULTISPECIES: hypothetical protein [Gluconobacter]MBS1023047.1 hypothetical protein [Gluconobacter cerinus]MBS1025442.1 hypothetical protein [Gluconobacter cerinus]MBS1092440.1 hypothetical protein [Gluconobacter sp. Dm-74]
MSGTLTQQGPLGYVLQALDTHQSTIPAAERGLAKDLSDLTARLQENPALESDPKFTVQVAWLVQDWKALSGTGAEPQIPPILAAGLKAHGTDLPGLENEEIKALLAQAGSLEDRDLVRDLRKTALEMSEMSPEEQASVAAARLAAVLDYRITMSLSGTPARAQQIEPEPSPRLDAQPSEPAGTLAPEPAPEGTVSPEVQPPASAELPQPTVTEPEPPGAQSESESQEPQQAPQRQREILEPGLPPNDPFEDEGYLQSLEEEAGPFRENDEFEGDRSPSGSQGEMEAPRSQGAAEEDRTVHRDDQSKADQAEKEEPQETKKPAPSANASNRTSQPDADQAAVEHKPKAESKLNQPDEKVAATAATAANRRGLADFMSDLVGKSDDRQIQNRTRKVKEAARQVEEDLGALKRVGREFFEAFAKAASEPGQSESSVIAGMTDDGSHKALRAQLTASLEKTPGFAESWEKLRKSSQRLGKEVEVLGEEASKRDASSDPTVQSTEETAASVAKKLESLPGQEPGKDFLKEVGAALQRLVDRFHDFFTKDRKQGQEQSRDNSPSPEV